ncbi:hypothetical protein EC957_002274 [Mortierella hygrophila]|uniref:F-box domain-containing protein n=1 Tax=Mortierella hygrophila TaxID=979708 RepID=A0A9P6F563_9FUNG|nr:hypothetical protein EC957_002274 [Mortierella hygrophila]
MSTAVASSSSSACHRFLAIPELVAELAGCLDNKSLHRLMLTSRRLSSFCEPSIYHSVVLNSLDRCSFERIASRDYLGALARNVQHVRSLNLGLLFAVYQYHSALALQQQERDKDKEREREREREMGYNTSRGPVSIRGLLPVPEWSPLPDILSPQMDLVLLPPMCNLTHFKMSFTRSIHHRLHLAYLPSYESTSRSLLQATWLIHQSPHLVEIDMDYIDLESFEDTQTLPTVIYEELHIPKISNPELDIVAITQFIGSHCPNLRSIVQDNHQAGRELPLSLGILETMAPHSLQKLNCVQYLEQETIQNDLSGLFHRHSTTLRSITLSPCWQVRSNTLRTILCECRSLEEFVVIPAESPSHCGIDLVDAVAAPWVCTNIVRLFLVVNLQDLREPSPSSTITMTEATITGREDDSGDRDDVARMGAWKPYYKREGPIVFTAKEEDQFRLLELFYQQLGQLTQLEYLSLKAQLDTDLVEDGLLNGMQLWLTYQRNTLPGMLSLGDSKTGRPGFLHLFSGWKKLKSLMGSVALDTIETRKTVQLQEMKFMLEQWPALTQVEFMQVEEPEVEEEEEEVVVGDGGGGGPTALEWLQDERPDIEIIPHIQDDICAYLPRDSLAHCAVVSRLWSSVFTPYLYRSIDLTHTKTVAHFKDQAVAVSALVKYRNSVQTIMTSAVNKLMLAILRDDAMVVTSTAAAAAAFTDGVSSSSSVTALSIPLLPRFMRDTLDLWKFTSLRTFEWTVSKTTASSDLPNIPHKYDATYHLTSNTNNNDGSMAALQFISLHIDRLESISLKFGILTRQHVRSLKNLLRGPRPRLRMLVVEYVEADVRQSVVKRLIWTALALYGTKPVVDGSGGCDVDGDGGDRSHGQATLETFRLIWVRDWRYESDEVSDSDMEDENELNSHDHDDYDDDGHDHHPSFHSALQPRGQLRQSHVKHLSLSYNHCELDLALIMPLFQRCPDLESLSLWSISEDSLLDQLSVQLRKFCPRFRNLGVGGIHAEDTEISQLIVGCSRTVHHADDEPSITATPTAKITGLQEFRILSRIEDLDEISTLALGRCHGASLETLDFSQQTRFPAHLFLQLIKHCPRLRTLRCNIELRIEHQGQTIDYSALLSTQSNNINNDWPFAATLKCMDLAVYRGSDLEIDSNYRHGDGSVSDRYIAYLYTQVARLTHLEEWCLGGWMMLLRLDWGLEKLSGLKSLKVLDLREHTFIRLSEEEVEWIADNWTSLVEVWGLKSPNLQPIVQQLKALRPLIEIL